jgi:hypothetical protein
MEQANGEEPIATYRGLYVDVDAGRLQQQLMVSWRHSWSTLYHGRIEDNMRTAVSKAVRRTGCNQQYCFRTNSMVTWGVCSALSRAQSMRYGGEIEANMTQMPRSWRRLKGGMCRQGRSLQGAILVPQISFEFS